MILIINALRTIDSLQPPQPPIPAATPVPNMAAVPQLADITGGHAGKFAAAARSLHQDEHTIQGLLGQAKSMVMGCVQDLVGIAFSALQRAIPAALGLLVPNPAVQTAARSALMLIARQAVAEAIMRIKNLVMELATLIPALLDIANRAVHSAISPAGKDSADSLKKEQSALPAPQKQLSQQGAVSTARDLGDSHGANAGSVAGTSPDASASGSSSKGAAAVAAAKAQLGSPYVWGGTGNGGFDCSGLTQFAWRQAGVELPRLAQDQTVGQQVSAQELQQGDLVVWDGHVAMYSGNGMIIEAGDPVEESPLRTSNMGMSFKGFWRPTA